MEDGSYLFIHESSFSFCVPLCSSGLLSPDYYVISDAGPDMLGYAIYGPTGVLLWYSALEWPFERNDDYQNAKEFLVFLVALINLITSVPHPGGCNIHWTGDNIPSLTWVEEHRYKSNFAQRAFIALTFICLRFQIKVVEIQHRPGILMGPLMR